MPTVSDYRYEGKGDGPRACAWAVSRARGRTLPPSLNPGEGTIKRRMNTEKKGK
jgi:hypothetical protein